MGHKVHPTGFRLGIIRDWQAKWYADVHYAEFLQEDLKLRKFIRVKYPEAYISQVDIDRQAKEVSVTLHTARPGIVIGRGGQRVDEMRLHLEGLIGKRVRLNIREIRQPELDAYLVGRNIAEQMERRIAYRRAMKQAMFRTLQAGAKGIRICCAGRLGGAEIARRQMMHEGRVPLHTIRADIDYGCTEAHTTMGRIGVKVWIYKGEVLPERRKPEEEGAAEATPAETAAPAAELTGKPVAVAIAEALAAQPAAEEKKAAPVAAEIAQPAPAAKTEEKPKPVRRPRKKVEAAPEAEKAEKPAKAEKAVKAEKTEKPVKAPKAAKAEKAEKAGPPAEATTEVKKPRTRKKKEEKDAAA